MPTALMFLCQYQPGNCYTRELIHVSITKDALFVKMEQLN